MSTTFISHRMFVAALNQDRPAPAPSARQAARVGSGGAARSRPANQLTVEQFAAFAARYWPEFPFARNAEQLVA